ncbi:MAG: valine--tRNA ligase [Anaerolineales bacterium]|nr:valine--tRNA ligase [Anaerolineales bacterium]
MTLPKRYIPDQAEPLLSARWQDTGVYHFTPEYLGSKSARPVYSIDTPPPTVSGNLHLGHVYSYSHADFIARFWRMRGHNVYYPMGYDDNGLPTERLVEKRLGITAPQVGRAAFVEKCLQVSEQAELDYQALWQRLGLSIDWRYTYRTIDERSRRTSQLSFIDLFRKGLAYRRQAPAIWCPECRTAIAQAELNDLERASEFVTLDFRLEDGTTVPIATTRPELLPACVAVFVHPQDGRYRGLAGRKLRVPLFGQWVPVLEDPGADPDKGTGVVMCCTFGDTTDVSWWYTHELPLVEALQPDGCMSPAAGEFAGLHLDQARKRIKAALQNSGLILERKPTQQSVRVHERCDTPVEYIVAPQWFIRVLDFKDELLEAGEQVQWRPAHMKARYRAWVENLNWDWCISRQRYFGVPFPVWYCQDCGEAILAEEARLPVDPLEQAPGKPCKCGSSSFIAEQDVMDTWATSSLSPQIVGQWQPGSDGPLYPQVFPFSLRPQAHEIIRTWAFYTIVKSHFHFGALPWKDVLISGWGIAGEGMGKISKSRGGGPMSPMEMIERYSADAVRYWAASAGPGKDAIINEEKIQLGEKLVTKLWNVARFSQRFLDGYTPPASPPELTPADRWILARLQALIRRVTQLFEDYDYAAAKSEAEAFFWRDLADNYLEMCKQRLYDQAHPQYEAARYTLYHALLNTLKLFAPLLPYVTEQIYHDMIIPGEALEATSSIHTSPWPLPNPALEDEQALELGETLVEIATTVRRYKSEQNLSLGSELERLQLGIMQADRSQALEKAGADLMSVCRARQVEVASKLDIRLIILKAEGEPQIAIEL